MKARLVYSKRQGQSIIIIALIIVVLVGMVGLSVDVGNTYAQNRNAVRATDAAALAAMDKLIRGGDDTSIGKVIVASFKSNGITAQIDPTIAAQPGERDIKARYLDSNGNWIGSCYIGSCGSVPTNVTYIQINTTGKVDTYFARVLGQQTLPVKAQAFAAQCTPVNGVYPIGVNATDLDENGFISPTDPSEPPLFRYSDSTYQNLIGRRIYRKDNLDSPGSFSWLQWSTDRSAGNARSTNEMLALDGNLDLGFQEVNPWPDPNSTPPDRYPLYPGQLTPGDWIAANTGSSGSNDITAALDYHIKNRTILNLPIIDKTVGTGQTAAFHFNRMGAFYLIGYNLGGGGNSYFDLVYIGQANNKACLNTNINQGLKGLGLQGQVYLNPRWVIDTTAGQPVAYNLVLDVSGSMSWDFNGYGTYDGSNHDNSYTVPNGVKGDVQCESTNNPNPLGLDYTDRCIGGRNSAWKTQSERRVYVAKDAILKMINRMGPNDMVRVLAFSESQAGNVTASPRWMNPVSDKAALQTIVKEAGAYGGDNYKTDGGTPGPQALKKASEMFLASNGYTPTTCGGQSCKPVVIYLTDGVANVFLDGERNSARDICGTMSANQAESTADPCQLGTTSDGRRRPISAMVDVANNMKASMSKLEIYAVGLAQVPETGLPKVANDASYYFPASKPGYVDSILTSIQARATTAPCTAGGGYNWVNTVPSANTPSGTGLPSGVYGFVSIFAVNGASPIYGPLPIQHDTMSGVLSFRIPPPDPNNPSSTGITPGTYEMTAYIYYKGADGVTRQYDYFISPSSLHEANRIPFSVTSAGTLGSTVPIDPVFLDMAAAKQVCATTP